MSCLEPPEEDPVGVDLLESLVDIITCEAYSRTISASRPK